MSDGAAGAIVCDVRFRQESERQHCCYSRLGPFCADFKQLFSTRMGEWHNLCDRRHLWRWKRRCRGWSSSECRLYEALDRPGHRVR